MISRVLFRRAGNGQLRSRAVHAVVIIQVEKRLSALRWGGLLLLFHVVMVLINHHA